MTDPRAFHDLPYLDAYLRDIVRPRLERALQMVSLQLTESAWRQLMKILAADQPSGDDQSEAMIRRVLQEQMGLVLETKLSARIAEGQAVAPAPAPPPAEPLQVTVRPATLPLVNAVATGVRPDRGK
jgi:hypothetical protein